MDIAPFRGSRFSSGAGARPEDVTAPPYDVIAPTEHRALLERAPNNITRLTLGLDPGAVSSYEERGNCLDRWIEDGVLVRDEPSIYVYEVEYRVPTTGEALRMLGFTALGRLSPFEDRVVLRHEETFPKVVTDRRRLLEATRANLESIFLLYSDPHREIDSILRDVADRGQPLVRVEAKPGEFHSLHRVPDAQASRIARLMVPQRPIIADGHHRYTTSLLHHGEHPDQPGAAWQMMTFANLFGDGVAILATHRLLTLPGGGAQAAAARLAERLDAVTAENAELAVETRDGGLVHYRFPESVRAGKVGVARTAYALLHDVVIDEWLADLGGGAPEIAYYKEGTGEDEALRSGRGDVLFRMQPVGADEFRAVVEGGDVYPHKTTYFYPKLWSGLVLWRLETVE